MAIGPNGPPKRTGTPGEVGACGAEGLGGGPFQGRLQQGAGLRSGGLRGSLGAEDQVDLGAELSDQAGDEFQLICFLMFCCLN